jgi:hypothetical protein
MKKQIWLILLIFLSLNQAFADANGKIVVSTVDCESSAYTSLGFVCDIVNKIPGGSGLCEKTANTCFNGNQEVFTGLNIELASPTNIKNWTGFGAMGELYQAATVCMLRDIRSSPLTSSASASLVLGKATINQEVGFLSFNKDSRTYSGFQHAKICAPVVGCMDAFTQQFTLVPVVTDLKLSTSKVGEYQIYGSYALDYQTEGLNQGLNITLPALDVITPYGKFSAKPKFAISRGVGGVLAPYNSGNYLSTLASPLGKGKMEDLYGRNPGTKSCQVPPSHSVNGVSVWDNSIKGWISQIALGSRDANLKNPIWTPPTTEKFPIRPDLDTNVSRSTAEKTPNAYMGANVKVVYSPTDLIPDWIRDSGYINFSFDIFAQPTIDTTFASQFHLIETETAKLFPPYTDYRPAKLEQFKNFKAFNSTSAAARFALEAGLDLNIHLHVPLLFGSIDEDLVDIHPRTTVLEKIDSQNSGPAKIIEASSQGSKVLATKNLFQTYNTSLGSFDGVKHIQECLAKPTADGLLPPPPTYEPGNPGDLIKVIEYPCNICVGMNDKTFTNKDGKSETIKGFLLNLFPADESTRPASSRWKCDLVAESGCYDMCKFNPITKELTVVETALEMKAKGEVKNMPARCR